jgi:hypothetical protein
MSEATPWILLVLGLIGFLAAVWVFDRIMDAIARRPRPVEEPDSERAKAVRRSTSGAALAFQQVFDPGIEHVIRAERDAEEEEADPGGDGDPPEAVVEILRSDLLVALTRVPLQPEELRKVLAEAQREGLDWRSLYEEAVRATLADRPYLAPAMLPVSRVTPRTAE